MFNVKNILSALETKATAKLPIGEKEMNYIIKKFKKDMITALNVLWINSGSVITNENVGNSILFRNLDFGIGNKMSEVINNWREDMLKPLYGDIILNSGKMTSQIISDVIEKITKFDITNPTISSFVDRDTLAFVRDIHRTEFESLRDTIKWSVENNIRSDKVKLLMKDNVSLTARETNATFNTYSKTYDRELKAGLDRGMTQSAANKRAIRAAEKARVRHYKKLRNVRTERIYRTETSRLKHFSDIESFKQAKLTGKIDQATKTWIRTAYNDNWDSSKDNDGQTVDIESTFDSGDDYPNEINERCILNYGIKYKKGGV